MVKRPDIFKYLATTAKEVYMTEKECTHKCSKDVCLRCGNITAMRHYDCCGHKFRGWSAPHSKENCDQHLKIQEPQQVMLIPE